MRRATREERQSKANPIGDRKHRHTTPTKERHTDTPHTQNTRVTGNAGKQERQSLGFRYTPHTRVTGNAGKQERQRDEIDRQIDRKATSRKTPKAKTKIKYKQKHRKCERKSTSTSKKRIYTAGLVCKTRSECMSVENKSRRCRRGQAAETRLSHAHSLTNSS